MRYRINGTTVAVLSDETLVAGSAEKHYASFDFDESWDGYVKTVQFRRGAAVREALTSLMGTERSITCEIPWEVLADAGILQISVHGESATDSHATAYMPQKQIYGGAKSESTDGVPTPDVWQQLLTAIGDIKPHVGENGNWFVGEADTGVKAQGEQGEKGEKGDTGANGADGADGKDGADGYTPQKGVDYFTASDKAEMVSAVLAALPDGDEVSY